VVGKMEKIVDYGYRSTHLMTTLSKDMVKRFYAAEPSRSYFMACSTGGAQGVQEALKYPQDYDGIVIGAMAHDRRACARRGPLGLRRHAEGHDDIPHAGEAHAVGE
jgi:hypothetical protein